jgi:hypothetical protein
MMLCCGGYEAMGVLKTEKVEFFLSNIPLLLSILRSEAAPPYPGHRSPFSFHPLVSLSLFLLQQVLRIIFELKRLQEGVARLEFWYLSQAPSYTIVINLLLSSSHEEGAPSSRP